MQAVERDRRLQQVGHAVLVGFAIFGKPIESLEEDLGVQSRPQFEQEAGLLLVVFAVPPVGRARRYGCLLSLPEASVLVLDLDTNGALEDLEMLLLERMDVQRGIAHSGPNPTQQRPARIPSGLPELYRVSLNWVVELLSCPRHSSYTSSRSPPKRCEHCINRVRAGEHGPALASS